MSPFKKLFSDSAKLTQFQFYLIVSFAEYFASIGLIYKYTPFYLYPLIFLFLLAKNISAGHLINRISDSSALRFVLPILFLILLASYFGFNSQFPEYDKKVDRDEALEISAGNLLRGDFIYAEKTQAGNPITPLPGAVIIFLPFYFTGGVLVMNCTFLLLLFIFTLNIAGVKKGASYLLLLTTTPVFLHEWIFEGDLIANSIYVLLCFGLVYGLKDESSLLKKVICVFLFGLSLTSRPVFFIYLLPILFSYKKLPESKNLLILSSVFSVLLTLSAYLFSPGDFLPMHVQGFLYSENNLTVIIISLFLLIYLFVRREMVSFELYLETISIGVVIVLIVQSVYRFMVYTQEDIYLFRERYPLFFLIPLLFSLIIRQKKESSS